ncbi:MAG: hypothetical protein LUQ40_05940 [Methanomicrobiales archaeon]|nr:hypothetical protein [Methanomicrobiales archaeon]
MTDHDFDVLIDRVQSVKAVLGRNPSASIANQPAKNFSTVTDSLSNDTESARLCREAIQHVRTGRQDPVREEAKTTTVIRPMTNAPTIFDNTVSQLNHTIEDGRVAFNRFNMLVNATLTLGLCMFAFSAIAGIGFGKDYLALIFGTMGIAVLFVIFLWKPKDQIQGAVSNLLQAQTVYQDFSNQVQLWGPYAREVGSMEEKRQASQALHDSTMFALKALQEYVKPHKSGKIFP